MKYSLIVITILLLCSGCDLHSKKLNNEVVNQVIDDDTIKIRVKQELIVFLNQPIDLVDFKMLKRSSNSGITDQENVYYKPSDSLKDGVYYGYLLFPSDNPDSFPESPVSMTVYKYGSRKHLWHDNNEILVGLDVYGKDKDLVKSDFVGLDKKSIIGRFGNSYIKSDSSLIYYYQNKFVEFDFNNGILEYYRYWNTKYPEIDSLKIVQIIRTR